MDYEGMLQSKSTSALTMSERQIMHPLQREEPNFMIFHFSVSCFFKNDNKRKDTRDGSHVNMHRRIRNGYVLYQSRNTFG